ncbi:hypothetical protein KB559_15340 [Paenibacillus sp. Marseille-P2973]|uniref:hypothetical protein n=1 Tax=Paenibacillus sp. Marseille-P2973 TaxID=1871032 RepID=UPI001B399BB3|nr:hypothetical protein [Paenibacillus sp. Marseille-P2973]MBQ4900208.1 hypothetical protein [Paenibacillus sp. Marseille-P2973]
MMLSEKDCLLLCELARTGLLKTQRSGPVMEIVRNLQNSLTGCGQGDLAQEILGSVNFAELELMEPREQASSNHYYVFMDKEHSGRTILVQESEETAETHTYNYDLNRIANELEETVGSGGSSTFIGIGLGGWRAAELAVKFNAEAVAFGAPSVDELPGKAINYVGEDDPVGDFTDKVRFVKQGEELDETDEALFYRRLEFDQDGKPVITEQSDFSRFVSWFYNTAGAVEPEIWRIFFPGAAEEEDLLQSDLGVYSVFLKLGELNKEGILRSLDEAVRFAGRQLENNRSEMAAELEKVTEEQFNARFEEIAETCAARASKIIDSIFDSVQTVLMGVALFTLEQENFEVEPWMDGFYVRIDELVDQELGRVKECLDQAMGRHLERTLQFPDFSMEW